MTAMLMPTELVIKQLKEQQARKRNGNYSQLKSLGKYKKSRHEKNPKEIHTYWTVIHTKLDGEERILADHEHNVFPTDCVDKIHVQMFTNSTLSGAGFVYLALTADTTQTINASQTALTGEISTNGLARVLAGTRTHTDNTNTTTLEHTFTLSGTQSDVTRAALFDASSGGTMGPFAAFTNGATGQMVSGETLKVTVTITTS